MCAKELLALCSLTLNHVRLLLNTQQARPDVHYINTSQVPTIITTVSEHQRQFSSPKSQWGCFNLKVLYLLKCRLRARVTQGLYVNCRISWSKDFTFFFFLRWHFPVKIQKMLSMNVWHKFCLPDSMGQWVCLQQKQLWQLRTLLIIVFHRVSVMGIFR